MTFFEFVREVVFIHQNSDTFWLVSLQRLLTYPNDFGVLSKDIGANDD